jgi:hypothetical protein
MLGVFAAATLSSHAVPVAAADLFSGQVFIGRAPVSGSTVTLWSAGTGAPKKLDQTHTSSDGRFEIHSFLHGDQKNFDLYVTARGGHVTAGKRTGDDPAVVLLAVLGNRAPDKVVINELTRDSSRATLSQGMNLVSKLPPETSRIWSTCRPADGVAYWSIP